MPNVILNKREYEWKILRYLNTQYHTSYDNKRTFKSIDSIELMDNEYYRVEANYTDHFISGDIDDKGIYFILTDEID